MKLNMFKFLLAAMTVCSTNAWTAEEEAETHKSITDGGMPLLEAFKNMPPKMLKTVMGAYGVVTAPGAFEYFTPEDVEVIFAAVSASNNCELCLSFHGMEMAGHGVAADDIATIAEGGVPTNTRLKKLVTGAKYSLAHEGIYLPREKTHLEMLGYTQPFILHELNYIVAHMSSNNYVYVSMIADGLKIEDFLHAAGPFAGTVYKDSIAVAAAKAAAAKKEEL